MRRHGEADAADGLGLHGHACWTYASDAELHAAVAAFLTDGLDLGQRLLYVGPGAGPALPAELEAIPDAQALVERHALEIVPLEQVYDVDGPQDAESRLATYAAATDRALADGYTGLRVAATVSALVAEQADWEEHTRWESVADRYMARRPMAALCCYDRRVLPEPIVADLCRIHPVTHAPHGFTRFRLFAEPDATAVDGEVDCFAADDFRRLLDTTVPRGEDRVIDLAELDFADHHGVLALADHVRQLSDRGANVAVRNAPYEVRRLSELLGVPLACADA